MLVITLGDPYSINCDLVSSYLRRHNCKPQNYPIVLVGSSWHWLRQLARLGTKKDEKISYIKSWAEVGEKGLWFLQIDEPKSLHKDVEFLSSYERGLIASRSLKALSFMPRREVLAVLTCPIDKSCVYKAGFSFSGQTEFFESLWDDTGCMLMLGDLLRVGLVTNHLSLREVPHSLSSQLILHKLKTFFLCLQRLCGIKEPRIGICGLNPHAGESGTLGFEDQEIIAPVVRFLQTSSLKGVFVGPLSADTLFWQAASGNYDGVLAMYHDQGLVPIKTLEFAKTVNVTAGLRHLRVSPAHGPAKDFFLKKDFEQASFKHAWNLAHQYLVSFQYEE